MNLNYPSWESGIPELLPADNPYDRTIVYSKAKKLKDREDIEVIIPIDKYYAGVWRIRDAWSYQEILHWLREKDIHIEMRCLDSDDEDRLMYRWRLFEKNEFGKMRLKMALTKFDYQEALDDAILYCLNELQGKETT